MHVLEVIRSLQHGGAEAALVRRLRKRPEGVRTTVLSADPGTNHFTDDVAEVAHQLERTRIRWSDAAWMRQFVSAVDPDVIVTHSPRETLRTLWWLGRESRPIVVVAHHEMAIDRRQFNAPASLALRLANPRAALHIAVSAAAARGPQCAGATRTEIAYLGGELLPASETPDVWPSTSRVRLLSLSRLVWFKNLVSLVEAVALVAPVMRGAHAHLAIVGDGPEFNAIAAKIHQTGTSDIISVHPAVSNPSGLLRAADALVVSSVSEGGPITIFEALLSGCRVLSTPTGVAPEVLPADGHHVLAEGPNPQDLAAAVASLVTLGPVSDDERRDRSSASSQYESSQASRRFYDLLGSVT